MKIHIRTLRQALLAFCLMATLGVSGQTLEWRLTNPVYSPIDPDGGGGPATGSVSFTLQIRTTSGTLSNVTGISTGWSWQSTQAMLPTGPAPVPTCGVSSFNQQPSNVTMSSAFASAGFTYNNVNQCSGSVNFTTGGQTFDRRAVGSVDGGTITLNTTFTDVFTVTLWSLGNSSPQAGYVVINSGAGGTPGAFNTYAVADVFANEYVVNSLTYTTPLALGAGPLPVLFTRYDAQCSNTGTSITWTTNTGKDNNYFEIEKSSDGNIWNSLGRINATGNSSSAKSYTFSDKAGGAALYRVKQVDMTGASTYTGIVRTYCNGKAFFVNLYPVPVRSKLTLVIGSDRTIKTTVQIVDNNGRVVMKVPLVINNGTNNYTLNVSHLAQGQYYLRGSEPGMEINQHFVISR